MSERTVGSDRATWNATVPCRPYVSLLYIETCGSDPYEESLGFTPLGGGFVTELRGRVAS